MHILSMGVLSVCSAQGFVISLDYTYDENNFFGNATAKAALEQAAADISAAITTPLSAVTTDSVTFNGTGDTATLINRGSFTNPATDAAENRDFSLNPIAADTYVIYVGSRIISGSVLGQGGAGFGLGASGTGPGGNISQSTVDGASELFENTFVRGGLEYATLSSTLGGSTFSATTGLTVGNLWFDHDTNNDGSLDDATTLDGSWQFDHTTGVASAKNDLYSVALHEMLHAVGIGTGDSWNANVLGTDWIGAEVNAANGGSGAGIIQAGGGHFASGLMSTRIDNGAAQEAAMDPEIITGTRKFLTQIDLAALRDMGLQTIPEPSNLLLFSLASLFCLRRKR